MKPIIESQQLLAIVFDWDGTLYDADYLRDLALEQVLLESQLLPSLMSVKQLLYRERQTSLFGALRIPTNGRAELLQSIRGRYERLETHATLFPGIYSMLVKLHSQKCKLGIVTGRDRPSFELAANRAEVGSLFTASVCSGEGPPKPDPAGLHLVLSELQPYDKAIFVGNSRSDSITAHRANIDFVPVAFCSRAIESAFGAANSSCCLEVSQLANILYSLGS